MAKLIVEHDTNSKIRIEIIEGEDGYGGQCPACGARANHWRRDDAIQEASIHIEVKHGG
jgi:hypothetical protein